MSEPSFWQSKTHPTGLLLTPLAWVYRGLEAVNRKLTQPQHPGKAVICVGNLTAGGAGKTPTVRWLAAQLAARNMPPAVLSRGYGGSEKGPLKVDTAAHNARQVGDEPLMLAKDLPVYIGADRMAGLRQAVQDGADVLIKDDGFQNPSLAHHFNLIVVDGATGLGNQRLLPAGPLRQPLDVALARLDALLVLGEATHDSVDFLMDAVEAFGKPVFHGVVGAAQTDGNKSGETVHGFCGIAKPEKFRASLEAQGYRLSGFTRFADHHNFTNAEAVQLLAADAPLITTEKDMARLHNAPANSPLAQLAATTQVLPVALSVDNETALVDVIEQAIQSGQANRLYKSY